MIVVCLVGAASAPACNSSSSSGASAPEAGPVCPLRPEDTIGVACAFEGLRCGPQYTCGFLQVTLLCVCTEGTFHCTDSTGAEVVAPPDCPAESGDAGGCPRTAPLTTLDPCTDDGLLCAYPTSCPGRFQQCQCAPGTFGDGGFGLRFACQALTCDESDGATAPVADASRPDADGGPSAATDAGDARAADAPSSADAPTDADAGVTLDAPSQDGTAEGGLSTTDAAAFDAPAADAPGDDDASASDAGSGEAAAADDAPPG
jgi:hypothetical protein